MRAPSGGGQTPPPPLAGGGWGEGACVHPRHWDGSPAPSPAPSRKGRGSFSLLASASARTPTLGFAPASANCSNPSLRRSSAAASGVSFIGVTFHCSNRPAKRRVRPSASMPWLNRPIRRDRPGSSATRTGAVVAAASEIIDTLSIVTTIASASPSMAKYGLSPTPSHTQPPTGARASVSSRTTAGSVRRDGVTTIPTWSRRAIAARSAASRPPTEASSRNRPLLPPTSTATSGRRNVAKRSRQASAAAASRSGVTRCSAVRVTTTFGPVSSSCRFTTIRSKRRVSMRGCCTCTSPATCRRNANPTRAAVPPQLMTRSGKGGRTASGTAASGIGHSFAATNFHGARGRRTRSSGCRPAASARPNAWLCRPARASLRIHDAGGSIMRGFSTRACRPSMRSRIRQQFSFCREAGAFRPVSWPAHGGRLPPARQNETCCASAGPGLWSRVLPDHVRSSPGTGLPRVRRGLPQCRGAVIGKSCRIAANTMKRPAGRRRPAATLRKAAADARL